MTEHEYEQAILRMCRGNMIKGAQSPCMRGLPNGSKVVVDNGRNVQIEGKWTSPTLAQGKTWGEVYQQLRGIPADEFYATLASSAKDSGY